DWRIFVNAGVTVAEGLDVALLDAGRYEETLEICELGTVSVYGVSEFLYGMQRCRVLALLSLGRYDEALANAKLLFNVAPTANTPEALELLVTCIQIARPG